MLDGVIVTCTLTDVFFKKNITSSPSDTKADISKTTTGKKRIVSVCVESQSKMYGPNRTRFLTVHNKILEESLMFLVLFKGSFKDPTYCSLVFLETLVKGSIQTDLDDGSRTIR